MHETNHICIDLQDSGQATINGSIGNIKSNLFSTTAAINPLIAVAQPLLSITTTYLSTLQHELRAFEIQAQLKNYAAEVIADARYLICAYLNEQFPQLNIIDKAKADSHCFTILEHHLRQPEQALDLLELGYLCLSLGFHGKYQQLQQQNELDIFIDQLYRIIQQQRGEAKPIFIKTDNKSQRSWQLPPWWLTAIGGCLVAACVHIPYSQKLNHQITSFIQYIHNTMTQP